MNYQESAKLIAIALTVFPEKQNMTKEQVRGMVVGWCLTLGDLNYSLAEAALTKVLQNSAFWPKPAEIREAAKSIMTSQKRVQGAPDVDTAWIEVCQKLDPYKAPEWSHPMIERAVKFIGYTNLCHSTNITSDRNQFTRIYEQFLKREKEERANQAVLKIVQQTQELLLNLGKEQTKKYE